MTIVNLVSAIGAIYLGIYLILPGCLCQLLETFGVTVHDRSIPQSECVLVGVTASFVCHCDHHASKTAELSPTQTEASIQTEFVTDLPTDSSDLPFSAEFTRTRQSRAPPNGAPALSHRIFSGVFLI